METKEVTLSDGSKWVLKAVDFLDEMDNPKNKGLEYLKKSQQFVKKVKERIEEPKDITEDEITEKLRVRYNGLVVLDALNHLDGLNEAFLQKLAEKDLSTETSHSSSSEDSAGETQPTDDHSP